MGIACSTSIACGGTLEDAFSAIRSIGIPKVDILTINGWVHVHTKDLADNFQPTIERTDALLKKYKLAAIATNSGVSLQLHDRSPNSNAQRLHEVAGLLRFMKHYGIAVAAIQPLSADRQRNWDDVLRDCVATLREQLAAGDAAGVKFALELHVHSPIETMEQARRFCDAMPEMPLVYDPTHFVMQSVPIRETAWLMKRAKHVHLRDAAPGKIQAPFKEGVVDFDWVFGALKDSGYRGHISIEYLGSKDVGFDVLDSTRRLYDAISAHFDA